MAIAFADRLNQVETSAIRELFKLLGKPGIISFAGGFPDSAMFDVEGIRAASEAALRDEPGAALQYGATEGYQPLREQLAAFMAGKGVAGLAPDGLIVTTGSQQAPATRYSAMETAFSACAGAHSSRDRSRETAGAIRAIHQRGRCCGELERRARWQRGASGRGNAAESFTARSRGR